MAGRVYVCAVPIGNLEDASPRLRRVLADADVIACEDTRMTRKLLTLLDVEPSGRLLAHHSHNERAGVDGLVPLLLEGSDVALVSDAGTPVVSDPGAALVAAAHDAGIEVVAVPGPSAVSAAVSIAGFVGDGYRFVGFLPRSAGKLRELAEAHAHEIVVGFEAPGRAAASVAAVAAVQPGRRVAACRELTKLHEQVVRGPAREVAQHLEEHAQRGEFVLVFDSLADGADDDVLDAGHVRLAADLVTAGLGTKDAARIVSEHLGSNKRGLYDALLAARRD